MYILYNEDNIKPHTNIHLQIRYKRHKMYMYWYPFYLKKLHISSKVWDAKR